MTLKSHVHSANSDRNNVWDIKGMKIYHFHYWLTMVSIGAIALSFLIYYDGKPILSGLMGISGIVLVFYSLAYIELNNETLTVKWKPYKKLVLRRIYLKDISSITTRKAGYLTSYYFWLNHDSESYTNWPAIGWPNAYQVGVETKNPIALVADVFQMIPDVEVDDMARAKIMKYSLRKG